MYILKSMELTGDPKPDSGDLKEDASLMAGEAILGVGFFLELFLERRGWGLFRSSHFVMSITVLDVAEGLGITGLSSEPHHLAEETQKGKDLSKTTIDASVSNLGPFPCGTMTRYPQRFDLGPSNPTVEEGIVKITIRKPKKVKTETEKMSTCNAPARKHEVLVK
ncbi:hypothetical protein U0070_000423 [Myodes glareolus]|uniref:Uncharacterized protein n=1 Tax=Myodes glareolus TaxID=447135 RepID=A0AAW0HRJ9_MYOGA